MLMTKVQQGPAGVQRDAAEKATWKLFGPESRNYECRIAVVAEEDDGGFSAHIENLPGAVGEGETINEAVENITALLPALLDEYLSTGEIPWEPVEIEGTVVCKKRIIVNV